MAGIEKQIETESKAIELKKDLPEIVSGDIDSDEYDYYETDDDGIETRKRVADTGMRCNL